MSDSYIIAYDGSDGAKRAAEFAIKQAKTSHAKLHLVYVLEWSPYSFLSAQELEERHKRRREELERANQHVLEPFMKQLESDGHQVTGEVLYGSVAKLLVQTAEEQQASMIFAAKVSDNSLSSKVLGTVTASLVNATTVPVMIVP